MTITNLFEQIPDALPDECISVLLSQSNVRIERIVSRGQSTPAGQWYEQTEHEWVMVLQGSGVIEYADGERVTLNIGDYLKKCHELLRVVMCIHGRNLIYVS